MVDRKDWGTIKGELENQSNAILSKLCYILKFKRSGRKEIKIQRVLESKYDFQYVLDRLAFLIFGLKLLDYSSVSELTGITREYGLPRQKSSKWDKIVEIVRSEKVTPRTLLGQLKDDKLEDLYYDIFADSSGLNRDGMTKAIIKHFNLNWLEEIMDTGFIIMSMTENSELENVYQIIKDECQKFDIRAERIDEIHSSDRITNDILEKIETTDYLFADLTFERPNVYYELGFCHGLGKDPKKIVLMAKEGTKLHFDIKDMRTIFYESPVNLKKQLKQRLGGITN